MLKQLKKRSNRKKLKNPTDLDVEKFSGLRIRNQLISSAELSNHFSDIRFVRLSTIKNLVTGDTLSGCWATVGVLIEKGSPKTSSTGKSYFIWKIGCLDEQPISIFLFGDAYKTHNKESASTVFAFFNAGVRKDALGSGFQLSVFNANQVLKMGTSIDYGVCKGRKKDGLPCTMVINKRRGIYCSYHRVKTSEKYAVTTRTELKGGNLRTAFRNPHQKEGIYMLNPLANTMKPKKTTKLLSVEGLKKALSNAGQVTTNPHSQGIRFLNEITVSMGPRTGKKECSQKSQIKSGSVKRSLPTAKSGSSVAKTSNQVDTKRARTEPRQVSAQETAEKMIELEYVSSDEDYIGAEFILGN